MVKKRVKNVFPPGWDEERVRRVIAHYQNQTDEEAIAEADAAFEEAERLEALERKIDIREVRKALEDIKKNGTVPLDEVKKELGLDD